MMFEIFNNTDKEIKVIDKLREYMNFAVDKLKVNEGIFNIIFVSNEEIHDINREFRHTDRVTDVISFALEDNEEEAFKEFRILGDIYIAIDVAYDQAIEYNHSETRELSFLTVHGLLHLLGYDHQTKEDEEVMFNLQRKILSDLNINR